MLYAITEFKQRKEKKSTIDLIIYYLHIEFTNIYFIFFYWFSMQNVQEADRPKLGFYIRSGITVVYKNSMIPDGTMI